MAKWVIPNMDYELTQEWNMVGIEELLGRQTRMMRDSDYESKDQSVMDMVVEYHKKAGQNTGREDVISQVNMVSEEWEEFTTEWDKYWVFSEHDDAHLVLKEMADLIYVLYGLARAIGWDLDEAVRRVHKNNLDRMHQDDGTIKRRADGKIIKNPNTPKVDLSDLT